MWVKDPKNGEPSVTLTAFMLGFCIASFKLMMSGIAIMDKVTFSQFTGGDFAAVVGALGALSWARRKEGDKEQ
jgi:hypothetical protein